MRRRVLTTAAYVAFFWAGHALGDRPDDRVRDAAVQLSTATGDLIRSCRAVLVMTAETGLKSANRSDALVGP